MRWFAILAATVALTACQPRELEVEDAWLRLPAVPGRPAAAYFTMEGGGIAWTLVGVGGTAFKRAELHETVATGMRRLPSVTVPAGEEVAFAPAGRHVMLYEVDSALKPGATVPLQLTFEEERTITVEAKVVGAADPVPD